MGMVVGGVADGSLANMVVPAEKLEEAVREMVKKIMANSRESLAAYKYLCNQGMRDTLKKGLELEAKSRYVNLSSEFYCPLGLAQHPATDIRHRVSVSTSCPILALRCRVSR